MYTISINQMDALMNDSGANLDFLLLLQEYLETKGSSLEDFIEWSKENEEV